MIGINKKSITKVFIYVSTMIFIAFLCTDIIFKDKTNLYSIYLKYSTIVLCFILSILIGKDGYSKKDTLLLQFAKFFTLIADYYLLITANYKLGILCFCAVQIIYIIRHSLMEKSIYKNVTFIIIALIMSLLTPILVNINSFDKSLLSLGSLYGALLVTSVYCGLSTLKRGYYPKKAAFFISIGITLFLLCDLNVALFNIVPYIGLGRYEFFTGFLIWIFYFPSQILLSLSGFKIQFLNSLFLDM